MKESESKNSKGSSQAENDLPTGFSPWQALKRKRISYLTLPLLVMATVTEFVILSTGWKYQQVVCVPNGMGVTFMGIGPIGATILAVELLKLPLAIWTASRVGWHKWFMLFLGLPLICVLTFQLVKDMAVYEMGVAMTPAAQFLEKASVEDTKISQLNGELANIEAKKKERERKIAELTARETKAKADEAELLKRNDDARKDATSLTDYQQKELAGVTARQTTIIQQFNADTDQINKTLADLKARREVEVQRASKWNVEEARIENAYKAKMADYTNKKKAYDKAKSEYDSANFIKRQVLKEPIDPGVPPEREVNTILKPTLVADLDAQIKAKEDELNAVSNKRREGLAAVEADARRIRDEFDRRSTTRRDEADKNRAELAGAQTLIAKELKTERQQADAELATAVQKVDGIRAELAASQKRAESYYEEREASIRKTQVHRIATTVEIIRGLIRGERPMSIKASAKERGDILTDQISMVRIWVYPILAFIVAFLPTLMVEVGFSTVFHPEKERPAYRLGFLGRRLHDLYIRAGRQKIARAERMQSEASTVIASRDAAIAEARADADAAVSEKENELLAAHAFNATTTANHEEQLRKLEAMHAEQTNNREKEWMAKFAEITNTLSRTAVEKDSLRDFQKAEVERQVQARQREWSDRINQMRQELEEQRAKSESERTALQESWSERHNQVRQELEQERSKSHAERTAGQSSSSERITQLRRELDEQRVKSEAERTAMMQEHQKKLLALTEESKTQVLQTRRQMADAELAVLEKTSKLEHDLKEALHGRELAEAHLKQQAQSHAKLLASAEESKSQVFHARRQVADAELAVMERVTKLEHDLKEAQTAREAAEAQLKHQAQAHAKLLATSEESKTQVFHARRQVADAEQAVVEKITKLEHDLKEALNAREVAGAQLKQQAQAHSGRLTQAQEEAARETEKAVRAERQKFERTQMEFEKTLRQRDDAFEHRLKQREQELNVAFGSRLAEEKAQIEKDAHLRELEKDRQLEERITELQKQWAAEARVREEDWERQTAARVRTAESRLATQAQQNEELFQSKLRQRDQQWQVKLDTARSETQAKSDEAVRRRATEAEAALRDLEVRLRKEMQEKEEAALAEARQREQALRDELNSEAEARRMAAQAKWESEAEVRVRAAIEPVKLQLARSEKEKSEARQASSDATRQLQELEKKLSDASSFFSSIRNGKPAGVS
jgi:DNA-binding transcriptional regulator YdaS (Cro superfamily)